MNRSSKGFGLTGVAIAVAVMIVVAVFSTSSRAQHNELRLTANHSIDGELPTPSRPQAD